MNKFIRRQLSIVILLTISAILFSISFPGLISKNGISYFSFIALIPMFHIVYKMKYIEGFIYGFIFGMGKYLLFNYWLSAFDPTAFAVAPAIHGLYFLLLFPVIILLFRKFNKLGFLAILVAWLSYEYFKSTNLVGYSYGILSHSMYKTNHFTGIADIIGSYLLSALIVFPGIFVTYIYGKKINFRTKYIKITAFIYISILLFSIIYSQIAKIDYSRSNSVKISLVQHNLNCWLKGSDLLYSQSYDHLEELSKAGESQGAELIIWPESAFVPAIEWHKKYRTNAGRNRVELIKKMENYFSNSNAYFIIGSNESVDKKKKINYNPAYLYKNGEILNKYRKINLVPFTEQYPFDDNLPWLLDYINNLGAKQMQPGSEQILFDLLDIKATILICYEDAFSKLPREGVTNGSNLLINITNDAWTSSPSAALQHLSAAALRTIENRRTLVRAGTSGFTGVIDPNGKIIASLDLFTKDQITTEVPLYSDKTTIYTNFGKYIDQIPYILFLITFIIIVIKEVREKKNK